MAAIFYGGTRYHYAANVHPFGPTAMQERAARLYPDSEYLQREWLRAVAVVRSTRNGWHLDQPVERKQ